MEKTKVSLFVAIGAIIVSIFAATYTYLALHPGQEVPIGAIGTMKVEDYVPVIKFNDGYYSSLPITLTGSDGDITTGDDLTVTDDLAVTGNSTLTGTSTITCSRDGFIANANLTIATTGVAASWRNDCGTNVMCADESGAVFFDGTNFAPALSVRIGTSTGITGPIAGTLIASTTVATSSGSAGVDQVVDVTYDAPFLLTPTQAIIAYLSDLDTTSASSTYFSNWDAELGFHCWMLGP